jgi:hypothetical protein
MADIMVVRQNAKEGALYGGVDEQACHVPEYQF